MARLPRAIYENLRLLCAELDGQLSNLQDYFNEPHASKAQKVIVRAGYSYALWSRVQSASLDGLKRKKTRQAQGLLLQNSALVARQLDLIARMARRSLIHAEEVRRKPLLRPEVYPKRIRGVRLLVSEVLGAFEAGNSRTAIKIGQGKSDLDALYGQLFTIYTRDMRKSKHTQDLANSLLVANEVRRMGDALQAISEALLSINIGQPVQFDRYFTLKNILSDADMDSEEMELETLAETRSGSGISELKGRTKSGDEVSAVFKDGEAGKLREEREGVNNWNAVYPGLAPQILSYKKNGPSAGLLVEYLQGQTFEHVLLNESEARLREAQTALAKTLRDVWRRTRSDEPADMASMKQLEGRLGDVCRLHPEFRSSTSRIGTLELDGFDDLVARAQIREEQLTAPFSVYIHGDFNLDNVIYDPTERRIHFIDLHRSRYTDYVQDISVFLVSNYRLQIQDVRTRQRVTQVASEFHRTARNFAKGQGDKTFEYRLALGLARSFATSTRFVFDNAHAQRMYIRARFLLEAALACQSGKEHRLRLPIKELFSG